MSARAASVLRLCLQTQCCVQFIRILAELRAQDTIREKKIDLSPGICANFSLRLSPLLHVIPLYLSSHISCLHIHCDPSNKRQKRKKRKKMSSTSYKLSEPRRIHKIIQSIVVEMFIDWPSNWIIVFALKLGDNDYYNLSMHVIISLYVKDKKGNWKGKLKNRYLKMKSKIQNHEMENRKS